MDILTDGNDCLYVANYLIEKFSIHNKEIVEKVNMIKSPGQVAVQVVPYCYTLANTALMEAVRKLVEIKLIKSMEQNQQNYNDDPTSALYSSNTSSMDQADDPNDLVNDSTSQTTEELIQTEVINSKLEKIKNIDLLEFLIICEYYYDSEAELVTTIRQFESIFLPKEDSNISLQGKSPLKDKIKPFPSRKASLMSAFTSNNG
jgi:hypothetical protein